MKIFILTGIFYFFLSCSGKVHQNKTEMTDVVLSPTRSTIIYKTSKDYFYHVPVTLDKETKKIIAYPHPSDVLTDGHLSLPTKLIKGYLLDNRGISPNSAFLNISYSNYAKLAEAPSISELNGMIIDDHAIIEMYDCGSRNNEVRIESLNDIIKMKFKDCKKIK